MCIRDRTYAAQRILTRHSSAREFPRSQISKTPFPNGEPPKDEAFRRLQQGAFADWRLGVDGLVARPASFSLAGLKSYSSRSQITHLACEEGWSFIAEWTGVPLSHVLDVVGILPQARYVVYFSIQRGWWDSVDMADALQMCIRDSGRHWTNVTPKEMPEWIQINSIEASPHDAQTAYVAATMYKWDDFRPYLFVTHDTGKTWTAINRGIPDHSFTRVVREDPNHPGLLVAGTETGMFISFNGGADWQAFQLNLPVVPITCLLYTSRCV